MDCCGLCLQKAELNYLSCPESLGIIENFLQQTSKWFMETLMLCETCQDNAESVKTLMTNIQESTAKIQAAMKESGLDTIDLQRLHKNVGMVTGNRSVCRLCLKVFGKARIFLYENGVNILDHDLIKSMFNFCNITLDFQISKNPVMCFDCWQLLQASYSFKKDYLETDRKIRLYCKVFRIRRRTLDNSSLHKVGSYFNEEVPSDMQLINNNESSLSEHKIEVKQEFDSPSINHIKREYPQRIKREYPGSTNSSKLMKVLSRKRHFSSEDDRVLLRIYFEKDIVENSSFGVWKELQKNFNELRADRQSSVMSLRYRIGALLNQSRLKGLSKEEIEKIRRNARKELNSKKNINVGLNPPILEEISPAAQETQKIDIDRKGNNDVPHLEVEGRYTPSTQTNGKITDVSPYQSTPTIDKVTPGDDKEAEYPFRKDDSDSDDYFVDEAAPSSFTPNIKAEPLSDDNEEIRIIEPSIVVRNNESKVLSDDELPTLERMDLPPLQIKIQDFYSVDVKREELNMLTNEGDRDNPFLVVEDLKTCRRISLKNEESSVFKCMQCSFETKHRFCADRHSKWHGKTKKKLYECQLCSYRISNKIAYERHMRFHKEKSSFDDIPVLYPFTMQY
ncbi:uncharacterized protein [Leptinotarsa decemlineata]|uniref:uncharacterized protein n=1 Tax=Leptinotarsa decemlineata TaxID=7539 RepID=UPI003D30646C